jgi:4-hydroxybenzoate polyprenyltransferase
MRPKSWLKNVFVFVPAVYALQLFNPDKLFPTVLAFIGFCAISSATYMFNDICDAEKDAAHSVKKNRPIPSGKVSKPQAAVLAAALAVGGLALTALLAGLTTGAFGLIYLVMNLAYTLYLKHKPIIDCFCIAAGFVLRVYAGGSATGEAVSEWLFLTIIAASLFMAFGKRRGEMLMNKDGSEFDTRKVLSRYDLAYLSGTVFACAGLSIVFYSLWAINRGSNMVYTVPFIIFIVLKYLLIIHDEKSLGDPTTVIFDDKAFLFSCGIYAVLTVFLLYCADGGIIKLNLF